MPYPAVTHRDLLGFFQVHRGAVPAQPLLLLIILAVKPIALVFHRRRRFEARPAVVRSVQALQHQPVGFPRKKTAPKAADSPSSDGYILVPLQPNPKPVVLVGRQAVGTAA